MSFNEDAVLSKLSTVNETQESIVAVSQWIMFHRRHAQVAAKIWAQFLSNAPPPRKLALIYLANEVVQQTKLRKKDEFANAFGEVIVDSIGEAYRVLPKDTKVRIKRVVDVWRQRAVFPAEVLNQLDERLARGGGKGVSELSSFTDITIPADMRELVSTQKVIDENSPPADKNFEAVIKDYKTLTERDALPAPPIYSRKLLEIQEGLEKCLAHHVNSVQARKKLVARLKELLETNDTTLTRQEQQVNELEDTIKAVKETKQQVDDMQYAEPEAPEIEAFTPPGEPPEPKKVSFAEIADTAPEYSPLSSDEDEDEDEDGPQTKKQKTDASPLGDTATAAPKAPPTLDPAVAALLSSLAKNNS